MRGLPSLHPVIAAGSVLLALACSPARSPQNASAGAEAGGEARSGESGGVAINLGLLKPGMARIPGGTFQMGSPDGEGEADEHPRHPVFVREFDMDITEVTVAAYTTCAKTLGCSPARSLDVPEIKAEDRALYQENCNGLRPDRPNHPINCVTWQQADLYCRTLNKRLPTEEEWEYAARGGTRMRRYPWGDEPPGIDRLNGCGGECVDMARRHNKQWRALFGARDAWPSTAPVGSFPAGKSAHGLADLAGNVFEWTASAYSKDYSRQHATAARVVRGGGWNSYQPEDLRAAFRLWLPPTFRGVSLGFRCAK